MSLVGPAVLIGLALTFLNSPKTLFGWPAIRRSLGSSAVPATLVRAIGAYLLLSSIVFVPGFWIRSGPIDISTPLSGIIHSAPILAPLLGVPFFLFAARIGTFLWLGSGADAHRGRRFVVFVCLSLAGYAFATSIGQLVDIRAKFFPVRGNVFDAIYRSLIGVALIAFASARARRSTESEGPNMTPALVLRMTFFFLGTVSVLELGWCLKQWLWTGELLAVYALALGLLPGLFLLVLPDHAERAWTAVRWHVLSRSRESWEPLPYAVASAFFLVPTLIWFSKLPLFYAAFQEDWTQLLLWGPWAALTIGLICFVARPSAALARGIRGPGGEEISAD